MIVEHINLTQTNDSKLIQDEGLKMKMGERPAIVQSLSEPTPTKIQHSNGDNGSEEASSGESRDTIHESTVPNFSQATHLRVSDARRSSSTYRDSPTSSRPNSPLASSRRSLPSSTTSTSVTVDIPTDRNRTENPKRPSLLTRLRSSISSTGISLHESRGPSIHPSDFCIPSEQPEKHFIDSIGMVIPGVINRQRCQHPLAHFVTNWRLCEPIEYTTALADHGITHSDYCRLLGALADFLDKIPNEPRKKPVSLAPWWHPRGWQAPQDAHVETRDPLSQNIVSRSRYMIESAQQFDIAKQQATSLNTLLEDISLNWQRRGIPVMVCISSFSLFAPNRISESHVQILHVSPQAPTPPKHVAIHRATKRLSFIDPFAVANTEERSVAGPRHKLNRRSMSPPSPSSTAALLHHHQQLQLRDRTRPWPLWPNAIPSQKRELMNRHADRYGVDPYFRAWMRADINSRTRCTSYVKYLIEKEDDPFVNKRLEYVTPFRSEPSWDLLTKTPTRWTGEHPSIVNRGNYEHNRRLECRKTVERGSRLRVVRFGFRHPIYPPHTPEMGDLGLSREAYQAIIDHIEDIRKDYRSNSKSCLPQFVASWNKIRRRSTEDALKKVSEYIRQVNAQDRRIVWTIEKIPGVYDRGFGRDRKEWEISAWNGEDPLDLLIQLEKWGIIEKKLNIDDDE